MGLHHGLFSSRPFEGVTALFSTNGELRNQNLAGGDKKLPASQGLENRFPAISIPGELVQFQVINVHVAVEFVVGLHLKSIYFANNLFLLSPLIHLVEQIKHTPPEGWPGKIRWHGFPGSSQKMVGLVEFLFPI